MLLSFEYDEIYFKSEPTLIGKTFEQAIFLYRQCSVIGLMFGDQRIKICPAGHTIIHETDKIIVIAEDDEKVVVSNSDSEENCPTFNSFRQNYSEKHSFDKERSLIEKNLVLGWNSKASLIAKQLDNYVRQGSELHVLTNQTKATKILTEQLVNELNRQKLYLHFGDVTNRIDLEKLDL